MLVSRKDALAVCQEFGFSTADGWTDDKLSRKLGELVTLHRTGEFVPEDDEVIAVLEKMEPLGLEGLKIGSSGCDLVAESEGGGDSIEDLCLLGVGDKVVISEEGVKPWKGIVQKILSGDSVEVRDRRGETWETTVDKCEVRIRATEVRSKQEGSPQSKSEKPKKSETEEEAEIRSMRERIRALEAKKKQRGGRKSGRDEIAVGVLRNHPDGGIVENLAEEVDAKWKRQGRKENITASLSAMERMVKAGILFGLLKMRGREVVWVISEKD